MLWFRSPSSPRRAPDDGVPSAEPARRRGVLLVNVGTPDGPDPASVRRYLSEFLADPHVIQLPRALRWMQPHLARFIAWRRGPHSALKYQQIWTERGSPLRAIMEDQAKALAALLPDEWQVFVGMRYGRPSIEAVLGEMASAGIEDVVVVPVYPQFSQTTTGTVVQEVYRVLRERGLHLNVSARTSWYDDAGYINAQARLIADYAGASGLTPRDCVLLFSAHGLPVRYVKRGDPYNRHITRTVELVLERLGWPSERSVLAYQSRMGPGEWLRPDAVESLRDLAQRGEKRVLVCPISFSVDCLETLEEIDLRYREQFEQLGGELFLCPALNTYDRFITALKNLVLRGPQPMTANRKTPPLLAPDEAPQAGGGPDLGTFVLIGASLSNRVGSGRGPRLAYSTPQALACIKRPHGEVGDLLARLQQDRLLDEALIWNTCHRFEFYGWLNGSGEHERACVIARMRAQLAGEGIHGLQLNVLFGAEAWHHLMRTIVGLNSGLPGDRDIIEQFRTAYQLAERAGAAGPRLKQLVEETVRLAGGAREETNWGRVDPGYCYAALTRLQAWLQAEGRMSLTAGASPALQQAATPPRYSPGLPSRFANCRHVVLGGSATSRSILETLYQHFEVKEREATLVYRAHQGGQMKTLRQAIGRGRRVRVDNYAAREVLHAIADADVVHFGIDRNEPVLTPELLAGLRDFAARPLLVIDFNTAGSTRDLEAVPGVCVWTAAQLDVEVNAYAEALCAEDRFEERVREVEEWIVTRTPPATTPALNLPCARSGQVVNPPCAACGRRFSQTAPTGSAA